MGDELVFAASILRTALEDYDDRAARILTFDLVTRVGVDVVAAEVVPLVLRAAMARFHRRELDLRQRTFIADTLKDCLFGFARGWAGGDGPRVVLASTSGDRREVSLVGLGLALRRYGWRISYLGCDVPIATLRDAVRALRPRVVGLGGSFDARAGLSPSALRELAAESSLRLFDADPSLARALGAKVLGSDLITEAWRLSRSVVAPVA